MQCLYKYSIKVYTHTHTRRFFIMYIYKITYLMERLPSYICITTIWIQFGIFSPLKRNLKESQVLNP